MTYFSTFQHQGTGADRFLAVLHQGARTVVGAVERWNGAVQARRDIEAYSRLSDRTFRDLGINRSEIRSIAHHGTGDRSRRQRGR